MPPFRGFPSSRLSCSRHLSSPRPTISSTATPPTNPSQTRCLWANKRPSRDPCLSRRPAAPARRLPQNYSHDAFLLHPRLSYAQAAPYSSPSAQLRSYSSSSGAASPSSSNRDDVSSEGPEPPDHMDEKERAIFDTLKKALDPLELQVEDISGGCGSMYAVAITADKFKGLPVIKQHRLVNEVLGDEIKKWHGMQLRTKAP